MKKFISLTVAVIMLITMFSFPVISNGATPPQTNYSNCKIIMPDTVMVNRAFTVQAQGDRQTAQGSIIGETRIVPEQYYYIERLNDGFYDGFAGDFFESPGDQVKTNLKMKQAGKYKIYFTFYRDRYNGSYFEALDDVTKSKTFYVLGSKYNIKFNANKGKVSKKTKKVQAGKKYGKLPTPKRKTTNF